MIPIKQILPKLKGLGKHLNFAKIAFTKGGFRHVTQYINGLITLNKKTIRQISKASIEENHHSAINRVLTSAKFEQDKLEQRYLRKIMYMTLGQYITLIFDDSLVEEMARTLKKPSHKDH